MSEPTNESRRRFLKYAVASVTAAAVAAGGYYIFGIKPETPVTPTTTSTIPYTPTTIASTSTPALSPLASYAKSKNQNGVVNISDAVIEKLGEKLSSDRLTDSSKALVDDLFDESQSAVVPSEVLQFAPPEYKPSVIQSLQLKTIDQLVVDGKFPDERIVGCGYLFSDNFSGDTKRWYIEQQGLDESAIDLLTRTRSLGNQDFARYAVGSLVCIQDHDPLTTAEISFLENPGNHFKVPRNGYLDDMESQGNPCDDFARNWRKMLERSGTEKEMESLDATEDWIYSTANWINLVTKSDNPEVIEAEQLKLKGGTPDPRDFKYKVPDYNTEQLVQYWLGKQNEFKRNDTLAQAIAMVNGLWVTMGTDEVRQAVYRDTNDILNFGRETSEIQRALGFPYNLEDYPLEANVCWAWANNSIIAEGGKDVPHAPLQYLLDGKKIDLKSYKWFTVSLETLDEMRKVVIEKWMDRNGKVDDIVGNLEFYFYFNNARLGDNGSTNWINGLHGYIDIDGEKVPSHNFYNVNWLFDYFLRTGKGIGVCGDEAALVDAFSKSVGISTNHRFWHGSGFGHTSVTYFNPQTQKWEVYSKQSEMALKYVHGKGSDVMMLRMPINQKEYFKSDEESGYLKILSVKKDPNEQELIEIYKEGLQTQTVKKSLLYY